MAERETKPRGDFRKGGLDVTLDPRGRKAPGFSSTLSHICPHLVAPFPQFLNKELYILILHEAPHIIQLLLTKGV